MTLHSLTPDASSTPVSIRRDRGVAVVTIDNPPVNALSWKVRGALQSAIQQAEADLSVGSIVLQGTSRAFIAGADIREFGSSAQPPTTRQIADAMERCSKPVIAAIEGVAFGGGCEIALACHYRIASSGARLAMPEVKLGLIPGGGGTQRLPRLIGMERALEMIVSGDPVSGSSALETGLVDRLVQEAVLEEAISFAMSVTSLDPDRRVSKRPPLVGSRAIIAAWRERVARQPVPLKAPLAAVEAIALAATLNYDEGADRERQIFRGLRSGEQSKALRHLFFAERAARRSGLLQIGPEGLELTRRGRQIADRLAKARQIAKVQPPNSTEAEAGEARQMIEEGLAATILEIDAVAVADGTWPPHLGGPGFRSDRQGREIGLPRPPPQGAKQK